MNNRNSNNGSRNEQDRGDHQAIDRWEDIKIILERDRDVGKRHMFFGIKMQRPIFENGEMGYYRLNTIIRTDGNYLKLSTSALAVLANYFYYNRDRITEAIDDVRNRNAKIDQMTDEQSCDPPSRFEGLESESESEGESDDDRSENEEDESDYEEVLIVNPPEARDESDNPAPTPGVAPRRTRRSAQ